MYLMYVDESGDTGVKMSRTNYFILSGLIVHELRWRQTLDDLVEFRRALRMQYKLKVRDEIHTQRMINGRVSENSGIPRNDRFMILRDSLDWLAARTDIGIITVVVEKADFESPAEVFETGWKYLIQRFENTLNYRNFPGPQNPDDRGLLIPDNTNGEELRLLLRKLRRFNPIPSHFHSEAQNQPIKSIVEDPVLRDSRHSYFIQLVDVCVYFAHQYLKPNKAVRKQGAKNYYARLEPIIIKKAAPAHPMGFAIAKK